VKRADGFACVGRKQDAGPRNLGYDETARQLRKRLERCHPSSTASVENYLAEALEHERPTVFDWLVEIIRAIAPAATKKRMASNLFFDDDHRSRQGESLAA
jgi:hypothetical protein